MQCHVVGRVVRKVEMARNWFRGPYVYINLYYEMWYAMKCRSVEKVSFFFFSPTRTKVMWKTIMKVQDPFLLQIENG